jgi:alpha-L-fucosidase 2
MQESASKRERKIFERIAMKWNTKSVLLTVLIMGVFTVMGATSAVSQDTIELTSAKFLNSGTQYPSREWDALRSKLTDYLAVYDEPIPSLLEVNTIPDAPICGGGKLTLALDGTHREVNYHITKSDFWTAIGVPQRLFPKFRVKPAPFCRLGLTVHNAASQPDGFRHVQDMAAAEVRSEMPLDGGMLYVRSVALAQRDLIVFEIEASDTVASLTVRLQADNGDDNFFIIEGVHDDATVWVRKEHKSFLTVNAAAALRISGAGNVRTTYTDQIEANLSFEVAPGHPVKLILSASGGKDEYQALDDALAGLDRTGTDDIPGLLEEHAAWWQTYWLKSWIDIHDTDIESFYYGAQYVLGCSTDLDGRVTPGLAGGWITSPNPIWGGTYTMNYNGEAPFWGLFSSNRGELILPYARVCMDFIPTGRLLAKELDTQGIVMPVMMGPWGLTDNNDALGQKSNASMAALSLIWHYNFSKDRDFLEQYAYPYVRELMDYWEDNLDLDDTGRYVIVGAARERNLGDLNPGLTLGLVRKVAQAAISFSREMGVDEDRRGLWQDYLDKLSDYPVEVVDGNLCFKEAENRMGVLTFGVGDNPCALTHVYPAGSLDEDVSGRGRIIARNTLRYIQSWNQGNAFPKIFSQAVRAEWPGAEILDIFRQRITSGTGPHEIVRRNNTFLPADHSFEGTGTIEFINTMLANANTGVLKVFDVWPAERDASFERLRVQGAFLVSGELEDGVVSRVDILSEQGGMCRMESCWAGHSIEVTRSGVTGAAVEVRRDAGVCAWDTVPGGVYRITVGAPVAEEAHNSPVMLVPVIDAVAGRGHEYTDAALDVLLTPENGATQLEFDVVYADESRRRCTAECRFSSRDETIAGVDSDGVVSNVGRGWTTIDTTAEIDGVRLNHSVSVYVLTAKVIAPVVVIPSMVGKGWGHESWMNYPNCLVGAEGIDGPDIISLHRANSYRVGMFVMNEGGESSSLKFDFGDVYSLDEMWVWNYNCPDDYRVLWWNGGTACGMRDVVLEYSEDGQQWTPLTTEGYPFRLARATGKQWMPATNLDDGMNSPIRFNGVKARYVKLTANPTVGIGTWGGEGFGLSEVRFTHR